MDKGGVPKAETAQLLGSYLVEELQEIDLRGYGTVSARFYSFPDYTASLLKVACQSTDKAQLTQAKYLSDLQSLPGVSNKNIRIADIDIPVWNVYRQGTIVALQMESDLYIVAADEEKGLVWVVDYVLGNAIQYASAEASVDVPMWLDRWDRYGFRHYYTPWAQPSNHPRGEPYNYFEEFDFAEKNEHSGILLWAQDDYIDTAEGHTNEQLWDWAFQEAKERNLPVGINIMTGGQGEGWFFNRYREQTISKMPQFCGSFHTIANPYFGGAGRLSWCSQEAKDYELAILQGIVSRAVESPNATTILEPHGELRHGQHDIFMEYGPVANVHFQGFLKERYLSLKDLNARWGSTYTSWDAVAVPEVASFLGWYGDALDLSGKWRVMFESADDRRGFDEQGLNKYGSVSSEEAPEEWYSVDFNDSNWPIVVAPGHDRTMFLKQQPAVYRRDFTVSDEFLKSSKQVWLYVWDLNAATGDYVKVVVNGTEVGKDILPHAVPHWGAYDISEIVRVGQNQLSLRLPKGILAYRVYLSHDAPNEYPNLGIEKNAQWVDFADWIVATRLDAVKRGMEMIRQVAPNQQITLMSPNGYEDGVRQLAVQYGGNFHNTGYMGAFWADDMPALMRGTRLPFSLEPGSPAADLEGFKKHLGLYSTQGLQGIDYFIHLGSIFWNEKIRDFFERNLALIKLIGKYHAPEAEVAALYSTRGNALTGYPWGEKPNTNLKAGYWAWNVRANLQGLYESDALTESSFTEGEDERYRVIIDSNTSIMEPEFIEEIKEYVERGGVFVTFVQSGRHTPTVQNAWPIEALTGFKVQDVDMLGSSGEPEQIRRLKPAPDQPVFHGDWNYAKANGLSLAPIMPDAKPLMLWEDGTVAVGMRAIGRGAIIQVGCKFTGKRIMDRYEPGPNDRNPQLPASFRALRELFTQILEWRGVPKVEWSFQPENLNLIWRHYESNNGLYDVWTVWNQSKRHEIQGQLTLKGKGKATWGYKIRNGQEFSITDERIPVSVQPMETLAYLTPRNRITEAPVVWFKLQRDWWRKPVTETIKDLSEPTRRFSVGLNDDWSLRKLGPDEDGSTYAGKGVDDSSWERTSLGIWRLHDNDTTRRFLLRKQFTVPTTWEGGDVGLWMQSWIPPTFYNYARVWIDGTLIYDWGRDGITNSNPNGILIPGKTYTIAVEFKSDGFVIGTRGNTWLWVWPKPSGTQSLAGMWKPSQDFLHYQKPMRIPGKYEARSLLNTSVEIPEVYKDYGIILSIDATGPLTGVLVNGNWVRRLHHHIGSRFDLNITPWIKFGEPNEIELVCMQGTGKGLVKAINLKFYEAGTYP